MITRRGRFRIPTCPFCAKLVRVGRVAAVPRSMSGRAARKRETVVYPVGQGARMRRKFASVFKIRSLLANQQ